ncbi:MAG: gas vesicle synthesis protein GvpL/GvpF [Haloquadratum walsbyi J07HQW1]|uniref:Gas vesicle synthesis protein GvpL/GvpF n=1 Tax=Haloquadratum walsbyi J07HQW1 TaxID=1238424 RepID=U1PC10_9EURY|nr:MAG: gas vesicle synthesis protein GvpL/GvpF [Haloquadratum walsbyi J07HQW1]
MSDNLYTYGVIEQEDIELTADGVGGADKIYTIEYRSLSAVVSDIDTTDPERTDEAVTNHNNVLQRILEYDDGRTVVPMSFGMAFKNGRTLKGVLRGARRALRSALNDIDGTIELGVKIISTGDESVDQSSLRADLSDRLSSVSINETEDDLFSDRLILNRSYLVERTERSTFDDTIDEIESDYGDDVTVQYTGPWAPYNFVDIHIGADQQTGRGGR